MKYKAVIRDVVIIWVLTALAGFTIGVTGVEGDSYIVGLAFANIIFGVVGFCISGCLAKSNRWKHLCIVALGVWLVSLINVLAASITLLSWFLGVILIYIMMGIGGSISYIFARTPVAPDETIKCQSSEIESKIAMNEKEAIELHTAEQFLKLYNSQEQTSFQITKHADAPDFHCQDKDGNFLFIEITLTEDRRGDIQSLLGRSDSRSPEALKQHLDEVKQGEASIFDSVSCLQDNVSLMAKNRIQPKLAKDYGSNVALVVRDVSPLGWSWETVTDEIASSLDLSHNPFDKGIWIISTSSSRIYRVV